ncbi:MAG TPA: hypothetical protein QGF35_08140, partial [Dehalococcoidia bacterium]|nr:hypothetical protein [Dehalococcoidia bacterium]
MRPYPDEIIQGLRWSLENAIIPDLTEDWTKQVAANCLTLLNILELRWENEPVLLAEDIDDMRGLFEESLSAFGHPPLSDNARVSALGQELRQTLGADYSVDDGSGPFVRLATENEACRGMLIKLIDGLEDAAE